MAPPSITLLRGSGRSMPRKRPGVKLALDSTSIMELNTVPEHLLVLGGGYVGLEFGQTNLPSSGPLSPSFWSGLALFRTAGRLGVGCALSSSSLHRSRSLLDYRAPGRKPVRGPCPAQSAAAPMK